MKSREHGPGLDQKLWQKVRLGMVGGGSDSIIGGTHLFALRADGYCELVAGACLSSRTSLYPLRSRK